MFGDVFESLQGFQSHDFVMYGFAIGDDDEAMKNYVQAFLFVLKMIYSPESTKKENIVWLKKELNYLIEIFQKIECS